MMVTDDFDRRNADSWNRQFCNYGAAFLFCILGTVSTAWAQADTLQLSSADPALLSQEYQLKAGINYRPASDKVCASLYDKQGSLSRLTTDLGELYCLSSGIDQLRQTDSRALSEADGQQWVVVDAVQNRGNPSLAQDLAAIGARHISQYRHVVSAQVPVSAIGRLAGLASLSLARRSQMLANVGSVTGQHVKALGIEALVNNGILTGSGMGIGTLSDSFDCLGGAAADVLSNDLPAGIINLQDEPGCASGTDESRSIMQLIHDILPAATQLHHSAFLGTADFANGIGELAANGADVIVDDVLYFAEPMFQDGIIAQAVDSAVAGGVPYFSSAGNSGDSSYEADFINSGLSINYGFGGRLMHDFDSGGGTDTFLSVTLPSGTSTVTLQWDQPALSASGLVGSASDFDLLILNSTNTTILGGSASSNIGADPVEIAQVTFGAATDVNIVIPYFNGPSGPGSPIASFVKIVISRSTAVFNEFDTQSSTAYGHNNAAGARAIGAADYFQTPPFGTDPAVIESFSSKGGTLIKFDTSGNPIADTDRNKPEMVGPDGVNTTFFGSDRPDPGDGSDLDSDPNFFGTSASAPIVATTAVQMIQLRPAITVTEIYNCMQRTTEDMGAPGFDNTTGNGYVQTLESLACGSGDWGDLPDTPYPTAGDDNSARHILTDSTLIGVSVDSEDDGQPNSDATGDDASGGDEDGVTFATPIVPGTTARIAVSSTAGALSAFVDLNSDGDFADTGETITSDQVVAAGTTNLDFSVPASATGVMASRVRITTNTGQGGAAATGVAISGEVEDYVLSALSGAVWDDEDGDGNMDGGEAILSGISTALLNSSGVAINDAAATPITQTTDGSGDYEYPGMPPAGYQVEFSLPPPWTFAPQGGDSAPNPATGRTGTTNLTAAATVSNINAGVLRRDWGDAPDSYGTSLANNGPRHITTGTLSLGSTLDTEGNGQPSATANAASDDDSSFFASFGSATSSYQLGVLVVNDTGSSANLLGWIDFDRNGVFDADEGVSATVPDQVDTTPVNIGLVWPNTAPLLDNDLDTDTTPTFARLRLTTDAITTADAAGTAASDGEVEDFSVPVDAATTPAFIVDLARVHSGGETRLDWSTSGEVGSIGFRVEKQAGDGRYYPIHQQEWLPALMQQAGGSYSVLDSSEYQHGPGYYRIVEQTSWGEQIIHGPLVAADISLTQSTEALNTEFIRLPKTQVKPAQRAATGKRLQAAAASAGLQSQPMGELLPLKMGIAEDGLYRLSARQLAEFWGVGRGTVRQWLRNTKVRLSSGGRSIPWRREGDELIFYGRGLSRDGGEGLYSAHRVYWLIPRQKGKQMTPKTRPKAAVAASQSVAVLDFEQDLFSLLSAAREPEEDYWLWQTMVAGQPSSENSEYAFDLPGLAAGGGSITVRLYGATDDHHAVQIRLNGQLLGSHSFSGLGGSDISLPVDPAQWSESNLLSVQALDSRASSLSVVMMDGYQVRYPRDHQAVDGSLDFELEVKTAVTLANFDTRPIIVEASNWRNPKWIQGGKKSRRNGAHAVSLSLTKGSYLSVESGQLKSPAWLRLRPTAALKRKNNKADYLLLSSAELTAGAEALAAYRSSRQGGRLSTRIAYLEDIEDLFNHGQPNPMALKAFIQYTQSQWKRSPGYIVLVGDGSFDYRQIVAQGQSLVPPLMIATDFGLFASDNAYTDWNNDGKPNVAIGRIPAKTSTELNRYVDKLRRYEVQPRLDIALVADNPDQGGNFSRDLTLIQAQAESPVSRIELETAGLAAARSQLQQAFNDGSQLIQYLGHGGVDRMAAEGLLLNTDVPALVHGSYPLVVGLSCLIGRYTLPDFDSLGEQLVMSPDGGAIAVWSTTGLSSNPEAVRLGRDFQTLWEQEYSIGAAVLRALQMQDVNAVYDLYTLLGDPAARQ